MTVWDGSYVITALCVYDLFRSNDEVLTNDKIYKFDKKCYVSYLTIKIVYSKQITVGLLLTKISSFFPLQNIHQYIKYLIR